MRPYSNQPFSLILKGKSKKGKQRIKQYGITWKVLEMGMPPCLDGEPGYKVCVTGSENSLRWILIDQDKDFEIVDSYGTLEIDLDTILASSDN